jgi:uncharacterized repeat protein (TIGR01451 family)
VNWAALAIALFLCALLFSTNSFATTLSWTTSANTNLVTNTDSNTSTGITITSHTTQFGGVPTFGSTIVNNASANGSPTGYVYMTQTGNVANNTQGQTTTFTFSEPVYNLSFTVYDIDGGPNCCGWNDIVDFNSDNGLPTSGVPAANVAYNLATGRASANANVNITNGLGNATVTWAGPVTSVTVKHFVGTQSAAIGGQYVAIGPLTFTFGPKLTIAKTSTGGVGTFDFSTNNILSAGSAPFTSTTATSSLTTATAGTTVTSGTQFKLFAANTATTITETAPGWVINPTPIVCTDSNTAVSGNTSPFNATVAGYAVTIAAANTKPGAVITCNITNAKRPTVQIAKTTTGTVGAFAFSGDNGFGSDTITTTLVGTPVNGAVKTLTAPATTTTLTETIPAGWTAISGTCTGTGSANVSFNPAATATTATIVLNATATAAVNALVCTFTNFKAIPQLTILKTPSSSGPFSVGQVVTYTYKVTNSGNVAMTAITVADTHNGNGVFVGPKNEVLTADNTPTGDTTDATANNGNWDTIGPGDVVTFTATYTVTQQDIDLRQ